MDLETPWLRDSLCHWLERLASSDRRENDRSAGGGEGIDTDDEFDQVLDFFDDTGVLDDPVRAVGYILRDDREVEAMRSLGVACDAVLDLSESTLDAIVATSQWEEFVGASRRALDVLRGDAPQE
jgi:hypothetical protein